ncbi:MAG: ankyrin repeat domain-containing protein [Alphaproteobacteria bacterium]
MTQKLFDAALAGEQSIFEDHKTLHPKVNWDSILDHDSNTLIAVAASKGKLHIIDYLVNDGASVDLENGKGHCALYIAYHDGHPNTARGLIKHYQNAKLPLPLSKEELKKLRA